MKMRLILAASFILTLGCQRDSAVVDLSATVKNSEGEPVSGAELKIDGKAIGTTNDKGLLNVEVDLGIEKELKIEISKQADSRFYYAPFFDLKRLEKGQKTFNVSGTLFFVPKPGSDGATVASNDGEKEPESAPSTVVEEDPTNGQSNPSAADQEIDQEPKDSLVAIDINEDSEAKVTEVKHKNSGTSIFTIHVYSANQPVRAASVYIGDSSQGSLKSGCETNARGRCVLRFREIPKGQTTFIVKKKGFQTASRSGEIAHRGKMRFNLKRGNTIDIFALTKSYSYSRGIANVEVFVQGKKVGLTDEFGHFTYVYTGRKSDLIDVLLRNRNFLPEEYETDFVMTGPVSLVRYFSPVKPPPVRVTLLRVQPAGRVSDAQMNLFDGKLDTSIAAASQRHIFSNKAFEEYPLIKFNEAASGAGKSLGAMVRKGWSTSSIKGSLDAVLLPTVVMKDSKVLELSLVDSNGKVVAAAKETLNSFEDESAIQHTVSVASKRIIRGFPFEGAVLGKDGNQITINIGYNSGRGIKSGDQIEIQGIQSDKLGRKQKHSKIATLVVEEVWEDLSRCRVVYLAPRATIHRGDLAIVHSKARKSLAVAKIKVLGRFDSGKVAPVAQANVYFNEKWIGATDTTGKLIADAGKANGRGVLKVLRTGYRDFSQEITVAKGRTVEVNLRKEMAFVRVVTNPPGAKVFVDGKQIGVSPLSKPTSVPTGISKLEIVGPPGFRKYMDVLDLDSGTIDFTGANTIELERDLISGANRLVRVGRFNDAIRELDKVPADHSDYYMASHMAGEIYLTKLRDPAKAADRFARVTKVPAIANFNDKRFIGSHINEGVAVFLTAERLAEKDEDLAKAHYAKAISILEGVKPQLRFVSKKQFKDAVNNVDYHSALAKHRVWTYTKDQALLTDTYKAWQSYIDRDDDSKGSYLENAKIFRKQLQASMKQSTVR